MKSLQTIRHLKPPWYPDQAVYAEYACMAFGLGFHEIDHGTGLAFFISSGERQIAFGAGRGSFFPQNNATAATLANDKYLASVVLAEAGIATLGGAYFFLHERHRAHRPPGHERADAFVQFARLGSAAFVKPLAGSRGDFAQAIFERASLATYMDEVSRYYDAILMQPIVAGREYRIFVLDDDIIYSASKTPPFVLGDGRHSIRDLLAQREADLRDHGISSVSPYADAGDLDAVLPAGVRREIAGRMNRSAGGSMVFEAPPAEAMTFALARRAAKALGLRAAAVDVFTDIGGNADDTRIIEVNANPSIRFLEDCDRDDLILKIWRHTFAATGLLDV